MENYTQLYCIHGVSNSLEELYEILTEKFDCRFKMAGEYVMPRTMFGPGGRRDVLFYVHADDVSKFEIPRAKYGKYGIRFWEDVLIGAERVGMLEAYPEGIFEKHPTKWVQRIVQ